MPPSQPVASAAAESGNGEREPEPAEPIRPADPNPPGMVVGGEASTAEKPKRGWWNRLSR